MKDVEFLVGKEAPLDKTVLPPYSDIVCNFLQELSGRLIREAKLYPDVLSFAYWCRKANLLKLKESASYGRLGRGMVFHITPSNVPVNFAFSLAFSLLAGNNNIVRVSSKKFPQVDLICRVMNEVLLNHPNLANKVRIIRYGHNQEVTAALSMQSDVRMVWGGDETVSLLKMEKTKPQCLDICFVDRYSVAMISGKEILSLSDSELIRLAEQFYNDTYLVDQNACSSPQLVLWYEDDLFGRERFWNAVYDCAKKRYTLQEAVCVDKYTRLCENAIDGIGIKTSQRFGNLLYRMDLETINLSTQQLRGVCGMFYEYSLNDWSELKKFVSNKYQTVTCFGINRQLLREFVINNGLNGIDRIVPIGKAVDIGIIWDGYDLIGMLSRVVALV